MKFLPVLFFVFLSTLAHALPPNVVGVHIASKHSAPGFNNENKGVFLRWADDAGAGFGGGVLQNSHEMTSAWSGYTFTSTGVTNLQARLELTAGVITNYPLCKICPLLQVGASAGFFKNNRVHFGWSPKVQRDGASVTHLFISHQF